MEKVFAIFDSDSTYATRFMEFFKKRINFEFEIAAFTKKECLEEFIKEHSIEILLAGDGYLPQDYNQDKIKYTYVLSNQIKKINSIDRPEIFRYQSVKNIMDQLLFDYNHQEYKDAPSCESKQIKVISIFAPVPEANKLIFAWSLASILSQSNKVMLLPFDALPIRILTMEDSKNHGLSEFIYYLKNNNPKLAAKLGGLIQYSGNLSFLTGLTNGMDLFSLNEEEVGRMLKTLGEQSEYNILILYVSHYSNTMVEILKRSDLIYMPITDLPYEKAVIHEWDKQMEFIGLGEKLKSIHKLILPREDWKGACSLFQDLRGYDAYGYAKEATDQLLGSEVGWTR